MLHETQSALSLKRARITLYSSKYSGTLEQHGMNERLRKVPPQLTLTHVKLFGHEAGRSAGTSIPLIQPLRSEMVALLVLSERKEKPAQKKGTLGLAKRTSIRAEAIHEPLFVELRFN